MTLKLRLFNRPYLFTFKFLWTTLFFVSIFSCLGLWQYHRAQQKQALISANAARAHQAPLTQEALKNKVRDYRYYPIQLQGHYDNQQLLFLDNKTHEGQVGYEVYTPFQISHSQTRILIDRGWVPQSPDRSQLPQIEPLEGELTLKGVLSPPPAYFALGAITEDPKAHFPLRIQYLNIKELEPVLGSALNPYIVWLDPAAPGGFVREWKVVLVGPERHIMYTVQWFAFALSLLVLFFVLNLHPQPRLSGMQGTSSPKSRPEKNE